VEYIVWDGQLTRPARSMNRKDSKEATRAEISADSLNCTMLQPPTSASTSSVQGNAIGVPGGE
jgi:hypothetical protein